jgi:hypothetical protein
MFLVPSIARLLFGHMCVLFSSMSRVCVCVCFSLLTYYMLITFIVVPCKCIKFSVVLWNYEKCLQELILIQKIKCQLVSIVFIHDISFKWSWHLGLLARSQYPKGPATGHLDTGFSWFPYVYKWMLRWSPSFQVATTCFSCSPPDLNFLVTYLIFVYM